MTGCGNKNSKSKDNWDEWFNRERLKEQIKRRRTYEVNTRNYLNSLVVEDDYTHWDNGGFFDDRDNSDCFH
jgi:hypothetical protein